jgi:hypothetical protein
MALHATLDTTDHHKVGYVQSSDPGGIGTGRVWVDTTGGIGGWIINVRNAANDGWEALGGAGGDSTAIHDDVSAEISAIDEKTVLVGDDLVLIEDSEVSNAKKRAKLSSVISLVPTPATRVEIEVHNGSGSAMSAGDLCYISGDSSGTPLVILADADAASTATKMLVVLAESIGDGSDGQAVVQGVLAGFTGLTASAIQYVSLTAGEFTETAPSATGDIVRVAGYAISTTEIFMSAGQSWVEVA